MPSASPTDPRAAARVLLTRPLPDAQRFAAMLADAVPGVPVVISPILRIVPVAHDAARLAAAEGLVFSSPHAVASVGPGRGRPALCVGPRTAELARAAGFDVTEGRGDAQGLIPLIRSAGVPLIHPHGRHLAQALPVPGMVVYDQQAQPLTAEALQLLAEPAPVILPVFSPRSARLVSQALPRKVVAPLWVVAISESARVEWSGPRQAMHLAARPDAQAMLNAVIDLLLREQ